MLPPELLKVIFGALSRDDLDALTLVNAWFRDIVLRDFADEPYGYFAGLKVHANLSYRFVLTTGDRFLCKDNDDFIRRMRFGRVGKLDFSNTHFDENLFNLLLPFKEAWRDGRVVAPYTFASPSLFERAFSELLFCKSMFVITSVDGHLGQPFLSLPAVRDCTSLDILRPPRPLTVAEIIEWLNMDSRCNAPRSLEIGADHLRDRVEELLQQLKTVRECPETP